MRVPDSVVIATWMSVPAVFALDQKMTFLTSVSFEQTLTTCPLKPAARFTGPTRLFSVLLVASAVQGMELNFAALAWETDGKVVGGRVTVSVM